jgi:hypothetical protein
MIYSHLFKVAVVGAVVTATVSAGPVTWAECLAVVLFTCGIGCSPLIVGGPAVGACLSPCITSGSASCSYLLPLGP